MAVIQSRRRSGRRLGLVEIADVGANLWRSAPGFWKQYQAERLRPVLKPAFTPAPHRWGDSRLYAALIGHSTVLLKINGLTLLTDPVFGQRAGIHLGLTTIGVKRLVEPALNITNLPHIDVILLSHAHMDHFDLPSLRALESPHTTVVTARQTSDLLRVGRYAAVHEVGWGESVSVGSLRIRGLEVNHWGARVRTDTYRGFNGYLIECSHRRVLFGGDTADTRNFRRVGGSRPIDLALMPIGAYDPWIRFHCTPEQAWRMAREANAERFLPIHHSTFRLGRDTAHQALERLRSAAGPAEQAIVLDQIGQEAIID